MNLHIKNTIIINRFFFCFYLLIITIPQNFKAQHKYTLDECTTLALKNNISIQQALLNVENAELTYRQTQAAILPSLNAGANHAYNFGKSIDRFTNTFANTWVLSQNFFLGSGFTLWSGFMQWHAIRSQDFLQRSQKERLAQQQRELKLAVTTAFLNLLLATELEAVAVQQAEASKLQFERSKKLVDLGQLSASVQFEMQAQWANDKMQQVVAQNSTRLAQLTLAQLVNEPNVFYIEIQTPAAIKDPPALPKTQIQLEDVVVQQNAYKALQWQVLSAEQNLKMSKGRLSPSITANAALGSGTSGLYKNIISQSITGEQPIGYLKSGDIVYTPVFSYKSEPVPFKDQISENLNRSVGLSINWPLFNGLQTQTAIKQAKIGLQLAQLNLELQRQTLLKEWIQAECNATGAYQKLLATIEQEAAVTEAFRISEQKFTQGALSVYEFNIQKSKYFITRSSTLQARYEYEFRIKIMDFYIAQSH